MDDDYLEEDYSVKVHRIQCGTAFTGMSLWTMTPSLMKHSTVTETSVHPSKIRNAADLG